MPLAPKALSTLLIAAVGMSAAVPPELVRQLAEIGRGVCVQETAQIYRPLHPRPPYRGIAIARNRRFGPDPLNVLDVFSPAGDLRSLPVLVYFPGLAGDKQQGGPNGDAFYDNIMLWAVKNGMVGVNVQRRAGRAWDDPAKDVALVVKWVNEKIAQYKGDPARVFIWSHSAGGVGVSTYVGHREYWVRNGSGIKGVILMSPPAFNILPAAPPLVPGGGLAACGQPNGKPAVQPPAGASIAQGRGPAKSAPAPAPPPRTKGFLQADPATQLARSNLPGLIKSNLPFFLSVAELDPRNVIAFAEGLRIELCNAGHCPAYVVFKEHSHISQIMSANTADTSVTGPILDWMKSVP